MILANDRFGMDFGPMRGIATYLLASFVAVLLCLVPFTRSEARTFVEIDCTRLADLLNAPTLPSDSIFKLRASATEGKSRSACTKLPRQPLIDLLRKSPDREHREMSALALAAGGAADSFSEISKAYLSGDIDPTTFDRVVSLLPAAGTDEVFIQALNGDNYGRAAHALKRLVAAKSAMGMAEFEAQIHGKRRTRISDDEIMKAALQLDLQRGATAIRQAAIAFPNRPDLKELISHAIQQLAEAKDTATLPLVRFLLLPERSPIPDGLQPVGTVGLGFDVAVTFDRQYLVKVTSVAPGGPAANAGVRPGETIVSVDGSSLTADARAMSREDFESLVRVRLRGLPASTIRIGKRSSDDALMMVVDVTRADKTRDVARALSNDIKDVLVRAALRLGESDGAIWGDVMRRWPEISESAFEGLARSGGVGQREFAAIVDEARDSQLNDVLYGCAMSATHGRSLEKLDSPVVAKLLIDLAVDPRHSRLGTQLGAIELPQGSADIRGAAEAEADHHREWLAVSCLGALREATAAPTLKGGISRLWALELDPKTPGFLRVSARNRVRFWIRALGFIGRAESTSALDELLSGHSDAGNYVNLLRESLKESKRIEHEQAR